MSAFAMMRGGVLEGVRNRNTYRLIAACMDLISLRMAWEATMYLRVMLNPVMHFQLTARQVEQLAPPLTAMLTIWLGVTLLINTRPEHDDSVGMHLFRILGTWSFACTLLTALTFVWRRMGEDLSRSFAILFPLCSLAALLVGRYIALLVALRMERKYVAPELVGLVGDGPGTWMLIERIGFSKEATVRVAGIVLPATGTTDNSPRPVPVLGTTRELASVINRARLGRLILIEDELEDGDVESCTKVAQSMGVTISRSFSQYHEPARMQFTRLCGLQLLEYKPITFTRKQEIIKWAFDAVTALLMLAVLAPAMLVIALLIKLTSKGPVLYKAARVGRGGRYFTFLKFRSMYVADCTNEEIRQVAKDGHIFKMKNDPRVTPVGSFLRRYSLDELPQLVNVLRGEMSLVGPRPLPAEDLDPDGQSTRFRSWSAGRSRVLPGLTGLWQVQGRSETGFERMMHLDLEYIQGWSLALDLRILLETPLAVISSRGAY